MANDIIRSVKGTRDFYPEEMYKRIWLYNQIKEVSESFGYEEYEGPILETLELYAAKSGEELVEKQSYVFDDRGGDRITLRPELTPTLARLVASKQNELTFPLRWWSFGPFWRYERPQKGRSREFFQWNIDMIGDYSPVGDAELISIAASFLKKVGLPSNEAKILVNHRKLMENSLQKLGIEEDTRPEVIRLIDRRDKMSTEKWEEFATDLGLNAKQIDGLIALLTNKNLWKESEDLSRTMEALDAFGLKEYIEFAPHIIRGLDYYTGAVFEAWDTQGDFRALFGGGRYDNLVSDVGGQPVSAVGFAMGDVVVSLLLEKLGKVPPYSGSPAQVFVTVFDDTLANLSIQLAAMLRSEGLKVTHYPLQAKLGKQFKYADRYGARFVIVLGPDEATNNQATLKDLKDGTQKVLAQKDLAKTILDKLACQ